MILERFKVPAKDQVHVSEAALRATVTQIFEKLGLSPEDAAEGADVLTMTDLRGVETHGVSNMLRMYVRDYKAGKLDPRPGWKIVRESPGTAVIDAERRLGIIVGPKAMRLAMEKARTVGVGVVTVYNSGHFGAIGHYAMQAAQEGMVGVCFTGAGLERGAHVRREAAARHQPDRARRAGAPRGADALRRRHVGDRRQQDPSGHPGRLAAAPGVGHGQGRHADHGGEAGLRPRRVPPGPARRHARAGLAQGLRLRADGRGPVHHAGRRRCRRCWRPGSGSKNHFAAYNIEAFTDPEQFKTTMDEMLRTLRTATPAPGEERVLYPGLSEAEEIVQDRRAHGIPLHKEVIEWFAECTRDLGLAPLAAMS